MNEFLDELQPVILAGGDDSHRGFERALARFGDSTLIESVYTILNFTFTKEPMIVTDDHKKFDGIESLKDALIVEDAYTNAFTLGAVATAFQYCDAPYVFAIGVNMPFISVDMINRMAYHIRMADAVVPVDDGTDICLHAVYNRRLVELMRTKLRSGENTLHSFFPEIDLVQIPVRKDKSEDAIFFGVHTHDDLKQAEEAYESMKSQDAPIIQALPKEALQ